MPHTDPQHSESDSAAQKRIEHIEKYAQVTREKAREYYLGYIRSYAAKMKGTQGVGRVVKALGYSWAGLQAAWEEAGFRLITFLHAAALIAAFALPLDLSVRMILVLTAGLTQAVELLNTGLEAAVDHTSLDRHFFAKRAKDTASAAFYLIFFVEILLWLMVLFHLT